MGDFATLALFAVLASLDNLDAACAIGLLPLRRSNRWALTIGFGACEFLLSYVGLVAGSAIRSNWFDWVNQASAVLLLLSGLAIAALALREHALENYADQPWILFGLPLTLSVDNLIAGAGLGSAGFHPLVSAIMIGVISATLSGVGITPSTKKPYEPIHCHRAMNTTGRITASTARWPRWTP